MARMRIRVTSDTGFVTSGNRTIGWERFDAETGVVLSSASEPIAASTCGATAERQAETIRNWLEARANEYLNTNTLLEPEYLTTAPNLTGTTWAIAMGYYLR